MWIKLIAGAAVALIIYLGYQFVTDLVAEISHWKSEASKFQIANTILDTKLTNIKSDLEKSYQLQDNLNQELQDTRIAMGNVIKLFSDHNFTKLVNRKPGLITIRMQKATKKLFKEIENETRRQPINVKKRNDKAPDETRNE